MTREKPRTAPRLHTSGLRRDIRILDAISADDSGRGLGVNQLAEITSRDKAQVSRVLTTLAEEGLVARDPSSGKYRIGWKVFSLAAQTIETSLNQLAAPYLREIVAGIHETTHLCVLRGGRVLTLLSEVPSHAFRGLNWQGVEVPVHHTSSGRVLLSEWSDTEIAEWWRENPPLTPRATPPALSRSDVTNSENQRPALELDTFLERVRQLRAVGYASVNEEFEPGLVGVSAPVRDFRGRIIAAINVAAPKTRLGDHLAEAGTYLRDVSNKLSQELGYEPAAEDANRTAQPQAKHFSS